VFISEAFAQAAPAAAADSPFGSMGGMIFPLLMVVALYFVVLRPQMKRQKEHKAMIEAIAKGDEVVIAGGMLGKIAKIGETYIHVEVASGVEVQVQRASVIQVLPKGTIK
jgi:preprotein translocase subunit YajC